MILIVLSLYNDIFGPRYDKSMLYYIHQYMFITMSKMAITNNHKIRNIHE